MKIFHASRLSYSYAHVRGSPAVQVFLQPLSFIHSHIHTCKLTSSHTSHSNTYSQLLAASRVDANVKTTVFQCHLLEQMAQKCKYAYQSIHRVSPPCSLLCCRKHFSSWVCRHHTLFTSVKLTRDHKYLVKLVHCPVTSM